MAETVINKAKAWLESGLDEDTNEAIRSMIDRNDDELIDSFYKDLEFGTGGLRGIMGVGSNRMNKYTVGRATQGLANYLLDTFKSERISVAVAHDSRNNSKFFAEVCANIFSSNGIKVFLFEDLRPTPELSFAIRKYGCKSGVVLTASHNPKEYNGYKAYWMDGAQLTQPHDNNVIKEVNAITDLGGLNFGGDPSLIELIGEETDRDYIEMIRDLSLAPEAISSQQDLGIVYSPIHGTGAKMVPWTLKELGFRNVMVVEEQMVADGNFPTVIYPNPEEAEALKMALQKAREVDADLVMATDPDADRVGIAVKNLDGEFELLNGNQTGSLLIGYLLRKWKETGKLDGRQFVVKTIVTTELIKQIADHYGVECFDTLTGFKYIATLIRDLEGVKEFIVGGEESYGYLIGDKVRDKDAVASCALIAEMTADLKSKGITVYEELINTYIAHGFYYESLVSITRKGKSGADEIQEMMRQFRDTPPEALAGSTVTTIIDYQEGTSTDLQTGRKQDIDFPKSNVLQFITADGTKVSARPSGTEPKIKFYFGVRSDLASAEDFKSTREELINKVESLKSDLGF